MGLERSCDMKKLNWIDIADKAGQLFLMLATISYVVFGLTTMLAYHLS
jgi:hypothetical protein